MKKNRRKSPILCLFSILANTLDRSNTCEPIPNLPCYVHKYHPRWAVFDILSKFWVIHFYAPKTYRKFFTPKMFNFFVLLDQIKENLKNYGEYLKHYRRTKEKMYYRGAAPPDKVGGEINSSVTRNTPHKLGANTHMRNTICLRILVQLSTITFFFHRIFCVDLYL